MHKPPADRIRDELGDILRGMGRLVAELDPADLSPAQIAELLVFYDAVERVGTVGRMLMATSGT